MMYSAEYEITLSNLVKIFSSNIGVKNSVGFFTCDVFCPICHILYEFDRFLQHMCRISLNYSRLI